MTDGELRLRLNEAFRERLAAELNAGPITMDEAQSRVLNLMERCREALPVDVPPPVLTVTAEPLTDEDRREHRLRFTIRPEPVVFDFTIRLTTDEG